MTRKTISKILVAFGLLAIILIFLGVNYVPRVSAFSTVNQNTVDSQLLRDVSAARWQAMGEYYSKLSALVPNFDANLIRNVSAARWQALGEAYLTVNLRARQADAARWQAMGEYYSKLSALVPNFDANLIRDVSAVRWQALGEAYLAVNLKARQADVARWQAMGEYYSKHSTH